MSHHILPFRGVPAIGAALLLAAGTTFAAEKPDAADKKPGAPASHKISRGDLKTKVQFDAVFEAAEMEPLKLQPKAWNDLTVLEAVPHGARVKKGEVLVKLDAEKLRDQIDDLEQDRPGAAVALELAAAELENLQQTTPLKLEAAKRSQRIADEDYSYFESIGRSQREKSSKFSLKSADQRLEGALEELKQLQKMYQADDLTEETEEIILKRQKFSVEAAQFSLDSTRLSTERDQKTLIPREHENLKNQRRDTELALTLAEQTLPKALTRKTLDVEKLKRDQKKAAKRLTDLKTDLENLTVRSPIDGLVYYGACENGKWTTGPIVAKKLVSGGKLMPSEVFMTVVDPDKLVLKASATEADLGKLKTGLKGTAAPVAAPDKKLPVKLETIDYVPQPGGSFQTTLSVKPEKALRLMPGMNCKVSFEDLRKSDVLVAPKEAVFGEGDDKHVFALLADGGHEKRKVKTGESDDKQVEITDGLAEGDRILLKKPD